MLLNDIYTYIKNYAPGIARGFSFFKMSHVSSISNNPLSIRTGFKIYHWSEERSMYNLEIVL